MTDWFTIEVIDNETFALSEYKHWEEAHSYLLIGKRRALLIDSGLGVDNIKNVVKSLTSLPVIVAATHVHWDHIGGHALFGDIAVHGAEAQWLAGEFPIPLEVVKYNLTKEPCDFPQEFSVENYRIYSNGANRILHDGDIINLGDRYVTVVHTPGHSPGHCCFYEATKKYLFTGDLIYKGCLDAFYPSTDPIQFMCSVARIKYLPVTMVLPAHHQLNIPVNLINEVYRAFKELYDKNKLKQGNGVFDFGSFQIHV